MACATAVAPALLLTLFALLGVSIAFSSRATVRERFRRAELGEHFLKDLGLTRGSFVLVSMPGESREMPTLEPFLGHVVNTQDGRAKITIPVNDVDKAAGRSEELGTLGYGKTLKARKGLKSILNQIPPSKSRLLGGSYLLVEWNPESRLILLPSVQASLVTDFYCDDSCLADIEYPPSVDGSIDVNADLEEGDREVIGVVEAGKFYNNFDNTLQPPPGETYGDSRNVKPPTYRKTTGTQPIRLVNSGLNCDPIGGIIRSPSDESYIPEEWGELEQRAWKENCAVYANILGEDEDEDAPRGEIVTTYRLSGPGSPEEKMEKCTDYMDKHHRGEYDLLQLKEGGDDPPGDDECTAYASWTNLNTQVTYPADPDARGKGIRVIPFPKTDAQETFWTLDLRGPGSGDYFQPAGSNTSSCHIRGSNSTNQFDPLVGRTRCIDGDAEQGGRLKSLCPGGMIRVNDGRQQNTNKSGIAGSGTCSGTTRWTSYCRRVCNTTCPQIGNSRGLRRFSESTALNYEEDEKGPGIANCAYQLKQFKSAKDVTCFTEGIDCPGQTDDSFAGFPDESINAQVLESFCKRGTNAVTEDICYNGCYPGNDEDRPTWCDSQVVDVCLDNKGSPEWRRGTLNGLRCSCITAFSDNPGGPGMGPGLAFCFNTDCHIGNNSYKTSDYLLLLTNKPDCVGLCAYIQICYAEGESECHQDIAEIVNQCGEQELHKAGEPFPWIWVILAVVVVACVLIIVTAIALAWSKKRPNPS